MRLSVPKSLFVVLACAVVVAGCGSKSASSASVAEVKSAFLHHGVPLQGPRTVRVAGVRASALQYDVSKLITGRAVAGQWLVVLVFATRSDAGQLLSDSHERQVMQAYNLTVIAHENVVVTILHGAATPDHLRRIRAAVAQATGG